jgi:alkyl hydroperoxide reductase subunit AhpF
VIKKEKSMPLLQPDLRSQLADIFAKQFQDPVVVKFFTQKSSPLSAPVRECHTCHEAGELLKEVAGLSDKLRLEVHDLITEGEEARRLGIDKIPGLVIQGKGKGVTRYFGVPAGYEFAVLIEALGDASRGTTRLAPATRQRLGELRGPVQIKVLVTPT